MDLQPIHNSANLPKQNRPYTIPITEKVLTLIAKTATGLGYVGGAYMTLISVLKAFIWRNPNFDEAAVIAGFFYLIGITGHITFVQLRKKHRELKLIGVMLQNGGQTSIPEAAVGINLDIQKTTKLIKKMQDKDLIFPQTTEQGNIVYQLNGFDVPQNSAIQP